MILNTETVLNDSKKISELRKRTEITKHQENSWIPMAQYNSRTNSYVNFAMNLSAITAYTSAYTVSYVNDNFGKHWIDLLAIGKSEGYDNIGKNISTSIIASNVLAYTVTYTQQILDWQIVQGTYIPNYYVPNHPDDADKPRKPMSPEGTVSADPRDDANFMKPGYIDVEYGNNN